jgi:hypothetical protein
MDVEAANLQDPTIVCANPSDYAHSQRLSFVVLDGAYQI